MHRSLSTDRCPVHCKKRGRQQWRKSEYGKEWVWKRLGKYRKDLFTCAKKCQIRMIHILSVVRVDLVAASNTVATDQRPRCYLAQHNEQAWEYGDRARERGIEISRAVKAMAKTKSKTKWKQDRESWGQGWQGRQGERVKHSDLGALWTETYICEKRLIKETYPFDTHL